MAHHFTPSYMYIARYRGGHWTGQTLIMHEKRRGTPSSRQKQLPSSSAITDILFPLSSVNQGNKEGRKEGRREGGREGEVSTVSALLFPLILPSYRERQQIIQSGYESFGTGKELHWVRGHFVCDWPRTKSNSISAAKAFIVP